MIRIVVVLCLALWSGAGAFGRCRPPHYRIGGILVESKSELIMSISISVREFAPARLICLATSLEERYRGRTSIIVHIFSSHEAASGSIGILPPEATEFDYDMLAQMHGRYVLDAERHENYVALIPALAPQFHMDRGFYDTRIDLPAAAAPRCHLEIHNRCLIALEDATYPYEALKRNASGKVTLTGTITRAGRVKDVHVVKTEPNPDEEKNLLVNAAVQNLSAWQVEPGSRRDPIQITYSYVIDKSLPGIDPTRVRWALPNEVRIEAPMVSPPPVVVSSTPSSGTGFAQSFTFVFSDPAGFSAISQVLFQIHPSSGSGPACSGYFDASADAVYLMNDDRNRWLGPLALGASGSLQNSQCIINSSGSSAAGSGINLSLTISLAFQAAFAGAKTIALSAVASPSVNSGLVSVATWTVP